jgi:MFS family permease
MDKIKQPIWTKNFILITSINLLIFFGFQMLLPTLPIYVKSLGGKDAVIGWLIGFATLAALIIRPFSGIALDRLGRKGVLLTGIGAMMAVTLAYMWFPIVGVILAIRFLHGFGWGIASTASNTVASDVIPKSRFGEGMGFFSLSSSLAMALAPGLGLWALSAFHITGLTLLSAGFGALALLLALLIGYQKVEPGIPAKAKASPYERSSIRAAVVMFFISSSYGSITGFISLYAIDLGITNIGVFFMVFAAAMLISRPFFGRLIDRMGFDAAVYPGLILLIAALFLLYRAAALPLFLLAAVLYGIGFGATQSSLQTMSVLQAPKDRLGAANATFFTGFDGGIGFGSIVAGILSSALSYSQMYLTFSLLPLLAGVLYFFVAGKRKTSPQ